MDVNIEALIDRHSGVVALAHLATVLEKFDLEFVSHEVHGADADHRRVRVLARGDDMPLEPLGEALVSVEGLSALLHVEQRPPPDEPLLTDAWLQAEEDALVNQIVWDYPRVQPLVEQFTAHLASEEREHRLTRLGVKVGGRIAAAWPSLEKLETVREALEQVVLPALKSIAVGEVEGGALHVTHSVFVRRNLDMMYMSVESDPGKCFFLTGLILGILRDSPRLHALRVSETECRETGGACCRFLVETSRPGTAKARGHQQTREDGNG